MPPYHYKNSHYKYFIIMNLNLPFRKTRVAERYQRPLWYQFGHVSILTASFQAWKFSLRRIRHHATIFIFIIGIFILVVRHKMVADLQMISLVIENCLVSIIRSLKSPLGMCMMRNLHWFTCWFNIYVALGEISRGLSIYICIYIYMECSRYLHCRLTQPLCSGYILHPRNKILN